jgi:hypothetical protein
MLAGAKDSIAISSPCCYPQGYARVIRDAISLHPIHLSHAQSMGRHAIQGKSPVPEKEIGRDRQNTTIFRMASQVNTCHPNRHSTHKPMIDALDAGTHFEPLITWVLVGPSGGTGCIRRGTTTTVRKLLIFFASVCLFTVSRVEWMLGLEGGAIASASARAGSGEGRGGDGDAVSSGFMVERWRWR